MQSGARLIKLLGLAGGVAIVAMALVGTSSAVAGSTLLCSNNTATETPTAAECARPTTVHFLSATAESINEAKAKLLSDLAEIECNVLMVAKKPSNASGPVVFSETTLSYTNCFCTKPGCSCTVKALKQGAISVSKTGAELAEVTATGFVVEVNCTGFSKCDYDAEGLVGHASGAAQAGTAGKGHVTYSKVKAHLLQDLLSPSGACPETSRLDALFQALTPVYIRSSPGEKGTLLCENNTKSLTPTAEECKSPTELHFLTVARDTPATLLNASLNVKCQVLFLGTVLDQLVVNGPVRIDVEAGGLIYSHCIPTGFCTVQNLEGGVLLVLRTGPELAQVTAHGFKVKVNCPLFFNCDYDGINLAGHAIGAAVGGNDNKAHVTYSGSKVNLNQDLAGGLCPAEALLDALFESLVPIYIRS